MRIAYLDCFSGISGDMFLGALLDAGVAFALLQKTVAELNVGATLEMSRVVRNGFAATKLDVIVGGEKDMPREEYWGKVATGQGLVDREHRHEPGHGHAHHEHALFEPGTADPSARTEVLGRDDNRKVNDSGREGNIASSRSGPDDSDTKGTAPHLDHLGHGAGRHHSHAPHRGLNDILKIIAAADISERAKQTASEIFLALGAAEAKVHNSTVEEIHFHEVGAADAIVDIVCAAIGAEALGVEQFICSPLNVGGGSVTCAHGVLPVPAPATLELLRSVPIYSGEIQKELVTPTGAAIVKVLVSSFGPRPAMTTATIGYGAGARDFAGHANVLRISVGETEAAGPGTGEGAADLAVEEIAIMEANLDDLNPQLIGYIMELALGEGALDVFLTPVQMKKNRPGTLLTVLARPDDEEKLSALLFRESSTLGVRTRREKRHVLARRHEAVMTPWGEVRMKVAGKDGAVSQYAPEYEDCRRIAAEHHLPLKTVMQEAIRLYLDQTHG